MCYSATSSFGTFFFVFLISCVLWIRGSKIQKGLSIILLFISFMQVIEGLLWLNIQCNSINIFITSFIPILLFFQPIVVIFIIYSFGIGLLPPLLYKILLGIWIFSIPLFLDWMKDGVGKCTTIGENGHLVWPYTNTSDHFFEQTLYNILMGIGIATLNTEWYGFFYLVMATLGYYKSRITYRHSWGSIWCHYVNILAAGALFI